MSIKDWDKEREQWEKEEREAWGSVKHLFEGKKDFGDGKFVPYVNKRLKQARKQASKPVSEAYLEHIVCKDCGG